MSAPQYFYNRKPVQRVLLRIRAMKAGIESTFENTRDESLGVNNVVVVLVEGAQECFAAFCLLFAEVRNRVERGLVQM